jgi:hypothetical protein
MAHKANPVAAVCARACPHRGPGLHPIRWRGCLRHRRTLRWACCECRRVHGYPMGHRALGTAALPILSLSPASRCLMPPWSALRSSPERPRSPDTTADLPMSSCCAGRRHSPGH